MPYDDDGYWYDDDDDDEYNGYEMCEICGGVNDCDTDMHREYDEINARLDHAICELKCGGCGGRIWTWGQCLDIQTCLAWQCYASCSEGCGLRYTVFWTDDDKYLFHHTGLTWSSDARYNEMPISLDNEDIPF